MIYLRSNSLIHLEVYFISLQTTQNPESLFCFSLKVAQKELENVMRGEQTSNEKHECNSLTFQYSNAEKEFLHFRHHCRIVNSNLQHPVLKVSMGLSSHTGMLMHSGEDVFRAVRSAGEGFMPSWCARGRQALHRKAATRMPAVGWECSPQASGERGLSEMKLCLVLEAGNQGKSPISWQAAQSTSSGALQASHLTPAVKIWGRHQGNLRALLWLPTTLWGGVSTGNEVTWNQRGYGRGTVMGVQILPVLLCFGAGILSWMAQLLIPAGLCSGYYASWALLSCWSEESKG